MTSVDDVHGFMIDGYGVKTLIPKGAWVIIEIFADKKGLWMMGEYLPQYVYATQATLAVS